MSSRYIDVAVPLPVTGTFTYSVPEDLAGRARVGTRVLVPFGRRKVTAFVVAEGVTPNVDDVKDVIEVLDVDPVVDEHMIELTRWIADYYLASWGEVLRSTLPPGINMESRRFLQVTEEGQRALERVDSARPSTSMPELNDRRRRVLEIVHERGKVSVAYARRAAGIPRGNRSDIDALIREGLVEESEEVRPPRAQGGKESVVRLSVDPEKALEHRAALEKRAPRQADALALLASAEECTMPASDLSAAGVGSATVAALIKKGLVQRAERGKPRLSVGLEGWGLREEGPLSTEQRAALDRIEGRIERGEFGVSLLHGVTGSGKTRVYSEAIRLALARGRGAIVLVPEISLTPQMVQRMRQDFGEKIAVVHSGLSLTERYDTWKAIMDGRFQVVVGPRSAVFAPVRNLGLIVVDEEHEQTYKQSESPRYHARDVATMRARLTGAVVLLGTATPSLESYLNAREGKYDLIELPERIDYGPLPEVEIVDMRVEHPVDSDGAFSGLLRDAVSETLSQGKQVILFLNRRGYASFVQCIACGHSEKCPNCNVALTYHSTDRTMRCHYCGFSVPAPAKCPGCGGINLRFGAPGTQRVEKAVRELFPDASVERMDVDTTTRHGSHWRILKDFAEGRTDVLLGTQMIAKGLDFPGVGLVGVIAADVGLNLPDFRSGERTFQLLTQVSGRTGRGEERGRVVVQSYLPEHYTIAMARDQLFAPFFEREIAEREGIGLGYPPFSRLVGIITRGRDEDSVKKAAGRLADFLERGASMMDDPRPEILGPAPAPLEKIKGVYRWQVLVRGKGGSARALVAGAIAQKSALKLPSAVTLAVDVDPLDML
ncbi:MAG: primosomal protein N' [Candidatus Eisenbacteria bacterium]|nr:primosomal protein N' [Candidatus Eisenbacteria bacterium]